MPRIADADLRSPTFKTRIKEADDYSGKHGLDKWGCRVVWVALTCGPLAARRYASKQNRDSKAWARHERLVDQGVLIPEQDAIVWSEGVEPWESNPLEWFNTLIHIAVGTTPPTHFPRNAA